MRHTGELKINVVRNDDIQVKEYVIGGIDGLLAEDIYKAISDGRPYAIQVHPLEIRPHSFNVSGFGAEPSHERYEKSAYIALTDIREAEVGEFSLWDGGHSPTIVMLDGGKRVFEEATWTIGPYGVVRRVR